MTSGDCDARKGDCVAPTVLGNLLRFIPRAMALGFLISHRWCFEGNGVACGAMGIGRGEDGRASCRCRPGPRPGVPPSPSRARRRVGAHGLHRVSARVISLPGPCLHLCKSVSSVDDLSLSAGSTQQALGIGGGKDVVRAEARRRGDAEGLDCEVDQAGRSLRVHRGENAPR